MVVTGGTAEGRPHAAQLYCATLQVPADRARRVADLFEEAQRPRAAAVSMWEDESGIWAVDAYYEAPVAAEELAALLASGDGAAAFPASGIVVRAVEQRDWVAESLERLHPIDAGRFWLHGSHDRDRRRADRCNIEVDANLAFGTGHHPTTRGCLLALDEVLKRGQPRAMLDLGCGTGVLAIALAKVTRRRVIASDIDPLAVAVARHNARLNGVGALVDVVAAAGLDQRRIRAGAPYDLIVANILARPLCRLAPALAAATRGRGRVVLSGLLPRQERRVTAAYVANGFASRRRLRLGGWSTLVLSKR